ncbi:hypothetical protein M446_0889 [Methylobacterium sp. 4-46]|nr:hypothetical protein M446_0889 [Methylobacterium sp. 4-46]
MEADEQGRRRPDAAMQALRIIEREPEAARRALAPDDAPPPHPEPP